MHGTNEMKKRVTITVEKMNYDPVCDCLKRLGIPYSGFLNAITGMLAYRLRGCTLQSDVHELKGILDDFMNGCR